MKVMVFHESDGVPEHYLGANIEKFHLPDGRESWSMSSHQYVQNVVEIVKSFLGQEGMKLKGKTEHPYPQHYRPEVDVSQELEPFPVQQYQQLIGILCWVIELGHVDIIMEVSLLSAHNVLPCEGHLEAVYHIFAYLRKHECLRIVFDEAMIDVDE
jgi:hypothetical protein